MFRLLRRQRRLHVSSPRQVARERLHSAIHRDRMEVSAPQLSALRDSMQSAIREHLAVTGEFTEFWLQRDGEEVFLVSRARLEDRG